MNSFFIFALKVLRKAYLSLSASKFKKRPECEKDADKAAQAIFDALMADRPCMIARLGSTELECIANYIGVKSENRSWFRYIQGRTLPWWWNHSIIKQMHMWSGFFPAEVLSVEKFSEMMLGDIPLVDILGSWLPDEFLFEKELETARKIHLELLNPYFSKIPWTRALEGKKVLVIHPFANTIESQYAKRELLFNNNLLPTFELKTIKAVQTIAGEESEFNDWFEALDSMKDAMDKVDYDICLIGCGAYGFPLAAHAKRRGKKGFHLGGSLQLLFGIKGKRWENLNYNDRYNYVQLMNQHWVKPSDEEKPNGALKVEGGCYW